MSANEVLDQVKALPPRERRKFFERVHEIEAIRSPPHNPSHPKVQARRTKLIKGLNKRHNSKIAEAELALEKVIDEMYPETKNPD